jgi:hypothetical protein
MWQPLLATIILTSLIVFLASWFKRKFTGRKQWTKLGAVNIFSVVIEALIALF